MNICRAYALLILPFPHWSLSLPVTSAGSSAHHSPKARARQRSAALCLIFTHSFDSPVLGYGFMYVFTSTNSKFFPLAWFLSWNPNAHRHPRTLLRCLIKPSQASALTSGQIIVQKIFSWFQHVVPIDNSLCIPESLSIVMSATYSEIRKK